MEKVKKNNSVYTIKTKSLFLIKVSLSSKTHDVGRHPVLCVTIHISCLHKHLMTVTSQQYASGQPKAFWHSLSLLEVLKVKTFLLGDESLCRFIVSCEKSKETLCSAALQQVNGRLALWGRTFNSAPVSHQQLVWSLLLLRAWRIKPHCLFLFWTNAFLITV